MTFPCERKFMKKQTRHVVTCLLQLMVAAIFAYVWKQQEWGKGKEKEKGGGWLSGWKEIQCILTFSLVNDSII